MHFNHFHLLVSYKRFLEYVLRRDGWVRQWCWVGWLFWVVRPFETVFQSISGRLPERGRKKTEMIDESKNVQTTPTRTHCKCSRPLPYCNPNCRTPRHWKFTQHHCTTRPPPAMVLGNFQSHSMLLIWRIVRQGPTVLAVGVDVDCLNIFLSPLPYLFSFSLSGRQLIHTEILS